MGQFYQGKDTKTCPMCHKIVSKRRYKEHMDKHGGVYAAKKRHPSNGLDWW